VELVAAQGYAEDHEEHESFVNCIAVAIRGGTGTVAAAVSMSVPDMRLNHEQVLATLPQVRTAAEAISDELGWDHPPAGKIRQCMPPSARSTAHVLVP
jgi:DNA-binding IclR family transcriptional regulator